MAPIIVYVTGFRQHAGKTTTSLGILTQLRKIFSPSCLGYIKPVGQELVKLPDGTKVDKDAPIMKQFSGIPDIDLKAISPVRLGHGFTQHYLCADDQIAQTRKLEDAILQSFASLAHKKVIIAEGSGHPGVGGIVGISNADVANLVGADLVFLSGGGIGKALDMLEVDLSYFLYKKSRVRGILFNKLIPEKMETVSRYISEDLLNRKYGAFGGPLRILGFLPETKNLSNPSMLTIVETFPALETIGDASSASWQLPCKAIRIISASLEHLKLEPTIQPRDIVILEASSRLRLRSLLDYHRRLGGQGGLGGLIFSCGFTEALDGESREAVLQAGLPALYVQEDTAAAERKLLEIYEGTKLQLYDLQKVAEIERLFERYFDLEKFLDTFKIKV